MILPDTRLLSQFLSAGGGPRLLRNRLTTNPPENWHFSAYGDETREEVNRNFQRLQSKKWPPPTSPADPFPFRAKATSKGALLNDKYSLLIEDFAGEKSENLIDSEKKSKLQGTDFLQDVIRSDAVMLAIDIERILDYSTEENKNYQMEMVNTVNAMLEKKGIEPGQKMQSPLALLFLKSDLLDEKQKYMITGYFNKLIPYCDKRCKSFKYFMVSSVGKVENGKPPREINPDNIFEPLLWILKQLNA